jgi:hypothetical protein
LGVPAKWLDNLLSRHALPGVERGGQGVERRITDQGLLAAEVSRVLNLELGVSMDRAASIAREMVPASGSQATFSTPSGISLRFNVADIESRLRLRMSEVLESTSRVPRGRPPRSGRK